MLKLNVAQCHAFYTKGRPRQSVLSTSGRTATSISQQKRPFVGDVGATRHHVIQLVYGWKDSAQYSERGPHEQGCSLALAATRQLSLVDWFEKQQISRRRLAQASSLPFEMHLAQKTAHNTPGLVCMSRGCSLALAAASQLLNS